MPLPMNRPLIRHSPPSPASTGCTLLRTRPPPSRSECDETLALRPCWMRSVEMLKPRCARARSCNARRQRSRRRQVRSRCCRTRHASAQRNIIFDDRGLALLLGDDQVARMRHQRRIARGRNKQQMNRARSSDDARGDVDVSRRLPRKQCSAQQKASRCMIKIAAEMRFERTRVGADFFRQAADLHACGQLVRWLKARVKTAHPRRPAGSAMPATPNGSSVLLRQLSRRAASSNGVFAIGETLVKRQSSSCVVGKPVSAEARKCVFAQLPQPGADRRRQRASRNSVKAFRDRLSDVLNVGRSRFVSHLSTGAFCARFGFDASCSRSLPAPAPVPGRRSARCGRSPAHARSRERCSPAGADSA